MSNFDILKFDVEKDGTINVIGDAQKAHMFMSSYMSGEHFESRDVIYWYWSPTVSYIGQTNDLKRRNEQHFKARPALFSRFSTLFAIYGSAVTDETMNALEAQLIRLYRQDCKKRPSSVKVEVSNKTLGNLSSSTAKVQRDLIPKIWAAMQNFGSKENDVHKYVYDDVQSVLNSLLYKYSVFNKLSAEQENIVDTIVTNPDKNFVIQGLAGTGKTALLTNLAVKIADTMNSGSKSLASEIPMGQKVAVVVKGNWIGNARDIFSNYGNPAISKPKRPDTLWVEQKASDDKYGVVIVDEAQRLVRDYPSDHMFKSWMRDSTCPYDNELDIVSNSARQTVLLYDCFQSIRPDDIPKDRFDSLTKGFERLYLTEQFRVNPADANHKYSGNDFTNG
ncbi:MAG: DNA/RNA helicase domain-containing protein [Bifidobacterium sp.]|uniref:DUF2075 domain-containing protein n=1 Tax=Bifidobacterium fermentum TaxID=3059035 RepID=A0AB39UNT2_9BIFI